MTDWEAGASEQKTDLCGFAGIFSVEREERKVEVVHFPKIFLAHRALIGAEVELMESDRG